MNRQHTKKPKNQQKSEVDKLLIQQFFDMKPLELPLYTHKDQTKLARFINNVHIMMNKLLNAC